jgi:2-aminoethylphosphonate-pyruvate transaminase
MNKLLLTPGPLTTSLSVKQAMLRDIGSRDAEFLEIVREIREQYCWRLETWRGPIMNVF